MFPNNSKGQEVDFATLPGLHFFPAGGSGEIGMNANFYCFNGRWLIVDLGVAFQRYPEAVIMADIRPLLQNIDIQAIDGLVVTHAHEDHVGAVAYLWPYLRCKVYATPFTANILRYKLLEMGMPLDCVVEIPLEQSVQIGESWNVEFVTLTHSIPEPSGLVIRTPGGNIFHTGDWKIDPEPMIGKPIDKDRMRRIGDEGILALVCDSTNVFEEGVSGSEAEVRAIMERLIKSCPRKVIISCFSSNLARVKSIYDAARAVGRKVCLVGRSLLRMVEAAKTVGYFDENITFIPSEDVPRYPDNEVLIMTTGSQAEPRAALTMMSLDKRPDLRIKEGDTVIFSSRVIPGNQESISALQNRLVHMGAKLIIRDEDMLKAIGADDEGVAVESGGEDLSWGRLHVSGHPCRDELKELYSWLRPEILVPVHGEAVHIQEQARLGLSCGIPHVFCPKNGDLIKFIPGKGAFLEGTIPAGRLALDGRRLIDGEGKVMRQRQNLAERGVLDVVLLIYKGQNQIREKILSCGVFESNTEKKEWGQTIRKLITDFFFTHDKDDHYDEQGEEHHEEESNSGEERDDEYDAAKKRRGGVRFLNHKDMEDKSGALRKVICNSFQAKWNKSPIVKVSFIFAGLSNANKPPYKARPQRA